MNASPIRPARVPVSLDAVAIFVEVVKAKSFSAAARRLGLPKSTVSVRVAELEARLGVALLHRTTRKLQATAAGDSYFAAASRSIGELRTAEHEVSQAQAEPSGALRVTSAGADTGHLSEHIANFLARYPRITVELLLTDQKLDLLGEGIDVAVRIGAVGNAPNLTAQRIGSVNRALYASAAYLRAYPAPSQPKELERHALLLASSSRELTLVRSDGGRSTVRLTPRFVANHPNAQRHQALRGNGIALLPTLLADEDVRANLLVRVLPDWATAASPVSLVYATQRYLPQRVRLFVAFMLEASGKRPPHRSRG